jgi:Ni,Fe-hydrogenase III small subunit/ferredoxin
MLNVILARIQQKHRTIAWPDGPPPPLPDRLRGCPAFGDRPCPAGCRACVDACPVGALDLAAGHPRIDLGKCLFCPECATACPQQTLAFTPDYRLATRQRDDLILTPGQPALRLAGALEGTLKSVLGRSLKLRQVSAGGCNACEADVNVLNTLAWDLGRFGIQFVASPRHADGLLVTGPVTANMRLALEKTWAAVPEPKIAIAVGACAIAGGPYAGHPEQANGAGSIIPIDLFVPGCPPHPLTILDGLLRLLGRVADCGTLGLRDACER